MTAGQEDGRGANKVAEVPHTKKQRFTRGRDRNVAEMQDKRMTGCRTEKLRRSILEGDRGAGQERLK